MAFSKNRRLADLISADGTSFVTAAHITDGVVAAADLHSTLDLTGKTVTVATASAGDNDTTVASTAFVSTAVSNLVDSAPGTLNTLNELAAALGDDANFSTTVTNSIATKLPLAGGTLTGALTGKAVTLAPDTAGKLTIRLTTNAANDGRIVMRSDTTDKVDIQTNGVSYFNGGDLLVGKTSTDFAVAGTRISDDGRVLATRSGNPILTLNRLSSDGEMQRFYKDGTQAGSIGANGGYIYVGSTNTNIRFHDGADAILPATAGGASRSAAIDLGTSGAKFKDLHISGIASIGNLKIGTDQGTDGQLLTSTGSGVAWEDAPASGPSKGLALAFSIIF